MTEEDRPVKREILEMRWAARKGVGLSNTMLTMRFLETLECLV